MKIYSALQIGEYHLNHCEDYLFVDNIGDDKVLCAVMDGCTMGIDSYFVSTLVGKLLRKISKEKGYKELYNLEKFTNLEDCLKSILKELFSELTISKNQLLLDKKELLTTLIILLLDKKSNEGIVLVVGDGLVSINGKSTEFDQDNKPDYLGFHLSEDFETWYKTQNQKILFSEIEDISIATDGIFMFTPVKKVENLEIINPIDFLIVDKENYENEEILSLKLKRLEHSFGLKPTDDFAMIRVINKTS
jgi:Protein phosphatase 2C